jgi:pyruvate/2-oxoglutarate dehydrogenase complex dihydrolipoamide dehydrogenase (E3) component
MTFKSFGTIWSEASAALAVGWFPSACSRILHSHVGLSEGDAKQQGITARVARLPVSVVLRAHTTDERRGFMKALIGNDDRILGFVMIGADADGVLAAVQTAMLADLPYSRLRDAIPTHPTMGEGLGLLFANVPPRP